MWQITSDCRKEALSNDALREGNWRSRVLQASPLLDPLEMYVSTRSTKARLSPDEIRICWRRSGESYVAESAAAKAISLLWTW